MDSCREDVEKGIKYGKPKVPQKTLIDEHPEENVQSNNVWSSDVVEKNIVTENEQPRSSVSLFCSLLVLLDEVIFFIFIFILKRTNLIFFFREKETYSVVN